MYVSCTIVFYIFNLAWIITNPIKTHRGPLRRVFFKMAAETPQPGEDLTTKFSQLFLVLYCVSFVSLFHVKIIFFLTYIQRSGSSRHI